MWSLTMKCHYGDNCSFAHGAHELQRRLNVPSNYKTVKCKNYHENMFCHFGSRCQFIHDPSPKETLDLNSMIQNQKLTKKAMELKRIFERLEHGNKEQFELVEALGEADRMSSVNSRRLPVFRKLHLFSW